MSDNSVHINCVCGTAYDGPRYRVLKCPTCGHIWRLRPQTSIYPDNHPFIPDSMAKLGSVSTQSFKENVDYTIEDGNLVFTSTYLLRRGSCCSNQCKNCPYKSAET